MRRSWSVVVTLVVMVSAVVVPSSAMGAEADTTPPVLHSIAFSTDAATPGTTVTLTVDATDDVAVTRVRATFYEETSGRYQQWESSGNADPRALSRDVTAAWANGSWRVREVTLYDAAGNLASYDRGGYLTVRPVQPITTHEVDVRSAAFTVTGASDLTGPVLEDFRITDPTTRAGEPMTVSWKVLGETKPFTVATSWRGVDAGEFESTPEVTATSPAGSSAVALPFPGRWTLSWVVVTDSLGNANRYITGGQVQSLGPDTLSRHHDIDLAAVTAALAPQAPVASIISRPGALTVSLRAPEPYAKTITSYTVRARPSGITQVVPVQATLPDDTMIVNLTGLPNGVDQTIEVTALSPWGDSDTSRWLGRPVLSTNVQGVGDLTGDGRPDVLAQRQFGTTSIGTAYTYPGSGSGGLRAASTFRTGTWDHCFHIGPFSDYRGSSRPLCQTDRLDAMDRYTDTELGTRGWSSMRFVDGGFDLNGDRTSDVIAVDPAGQLRLYAQTSHGKLVAWPRIGTGWGSMISVISAGDMDGDRRNDIVAVDASGRLWLYPGNGKGGVTARRQIGAGWQNMAALLPLRDLSGDGKADLGGITPGGELRLYRGTGSGAVRAGVVIGTGWQRYL